MIWKRRSIATKLFLAFLLTSILIIVVIAGLIGERMRAGFSSYLLEVELQTFDMLAENVSNAYSDQRLWQRLTSESGAWHELVRQSMGGPRNKPADGQGGSLNGNERARGAPQRPGGGRPARFPASDNRPPPPPGTPAGPRGGPGARGPAPAGGDPLQLGRRLALLSPQGAHLNGARLENRDYAARAIVAPRGEYEGETIALLALTSPQAGRAVRDEQFLIDQFRSLLLVSGLAVVLSALVAFLLARGLTIPIRSLVEGARELSAGNYRARLKGEGSDEIGQLVQDFNSLAANLEAAEKAERQWMSDASHELKTPLAILRGRIEGLQDGIYQADGPLLGEMHQTVERLSRLVSDLNILAHAREGKMLCSLCQENLSDLVEDAIQHIRGRYEEKGLEIASHLPPDLLLSCDRIRIRQLLDNLLENSRRYTDAPGEVLVTGRVDEERHVRLTIEDSAPRPERDEIGRLFERFYRTDPSRARQSGGSGLGLAICRAIVTAHGGEISAGPSSLGGLKVVILLPRNGETGASRE